MTKLFTFKLIVIVLVVCSQAAIAGGTYRPGSNTQIPLKAPPDKNKAKILPSNKPIEPINNKIGPRQKPFVSHVDTSCKRRSNSAKNIIRLREIGKTESEQLASTTDNNTKTLVQEVYQLRGTSTQIENEIALECMRQKKLAKVGGSSATSDPTVTSSNAVKKPSVCGTIKASLDDVDRRRIEGQGGSQKFLNDLQEQQYTLMREMKAAGCFNNPS